MKISACRNIGINSDPLSVHTRLPTYKAIRILNGIDRYGFSSVLADRCNKKFVPRSFANWVHGWTWHDQPTDELLACSKLPRTVTVIVCNERERKALLDSGFLDVRVGGLPFAYIKKQHYSRRADSLLAFPPHSAESAAVKSDQSDYLDYLESIKKNFEAVYVSIYHLDIGKAVHKGAIARGLSVVQGARPDDANSLLRMRSILDSFHYVSTNVIGSHMLYALFSGCKFSFCGPMYSYTEADFMGDGNPHRSSSNFVQFLLEIQTESYLRKRFNRFFVENPRLGIDDYSYATEQIGMRNLMTPEQIIDSLGWSLTGQIRGYFLGSLRRVIRKALH